MENLPSGMEMSQRGDNGTSCSSSSHRVIDRSAESLAEIDRRKAIESLEALKDSKKAWVVCFAAFLVQVIIVGILHVFGVFFVALVEEFQSSKATTAWIGSIAYGLSLALGPLTSSLIKRFGNRPVVVAGSLICSTSLLVSSFATNIETLFGTFSLMYALGTSLSYTPTMCMAGDYFKKRLTVATGFMVAGSSTGTLILSPIAQALVDRLGWRWCFRIFSGLCLVTVWSGMMFKPLYHIPKTPAQKIKTSVVRRVVAELQLWKNKVYVIWIVGMTCVMFGYYIPYVHIVSHAIDIGLSPQKGSILVMTIGGATATGRVLFGKVVEYGYLNRLRMHQMSMVISGTGCMVLPFIRSFPGLMIYVIFIGLVDGCFVVLLPVLTATLAGDGNTVLAWGFMVGISSITFTLGPPVAGWLRDYYGNYNLAFHVAGVPIIMAAVVLFLIPWAQKTAASTNVMQAARDSDSGSDESGESSAEEADLPPVRRVSRRRASTSSQETILIAARGSYIVIDMASQMVRSEQMTCLTKELSTEGVRAIDTLTRELARSAARARGSRVRSHSTSEAATSFSPQPADNPQGVNSQIDLTTWEIMGSPPRAAIRGATVHQSSLPCNNADSLSSLELDLFLSTVDKASPMGSSLSHASPSSSTLTTACPSALPPLIEAPDPLVAPPPFQTPESPTHGVSVVSSQTEAAEAGTGTETNSPQEVFSATIDLSDISLGPSSSAERSCSSC